MYIILFAFDNVADVSASCVSLTLLSQTWNSWRSSLRVSTGSSWSVGAAVRLSPSIPERAVPRCPTPLPRRTAPRPSPASPVLPPPSCPCCFNITPPSYSSPPPRSRVLIVPSHPTNSLDYRRLCPSDHTPSFCSS